MITFLSLITALNQYFAVRYQANLGVVLYLMAALYQVNLIDFSDGMGGGRFQQTPSLICDGTYCTGHSSKMYYAAMSLKSTMFVQHLAFFSFVS